MRNRVPRAIIGLVCIIKLELLYLDTVHIYLYLRPFYVCTSDDGV